MHPQTSALLPRLTTLSRNFATKRFSISLASIFYTMNFRTLFTKLSVVTIAALSFVVIAPSQRQPAVRAPRQERLLNGMKVLMWNDAAAARVNVRMRIHSGSAFDPQGKEGAMKLLAENLFPTEAARDYFKEDLGGELEIITGYDYIQINASSMPDQLLSLLETLATAVSNPAIDKETTASLKAVHLARLRSLMQDPVYVANSAAAAQLFGTFPYGRPREGTPASISKIDFADLIDMKQRFLTADNATLAVAGNIDVDLTYRAIRRYFGSWLKSDKLSPSTFRQPDPPKSGMRIVDSPIANKSEFRYAIRGVARGDKDFYASAVLASVLDRRFKATEGHAAFVRIEANTLPGAFIFGVSDWNLGRIKHEGDKMALPVTDGYEKNTLGKPLTADEFETAKRELVILHSQTDPVDPWLDADTYKLPAVQAQSDAMQAVTIGDVQRVLDRLQKEPVAYVLVFDDAADAKAAN